MGVPWPFGRLNELNDPYFERVNHKKEHPEFGIAYHCLRGFRNDLVCWVRQFCAGDKGHFNVMDCQNHWLDRSKQKQVSMRHERRCHQIVCGSARWSCWRCLQALQYESDRPIGWQACASGLWQLAARHCKWFAHKPSYEGGGVWSPTCWVNIDNSRWCLEHWPCGQVVQRPPKLLREDVFDSLDHCDWPQDSGNRTSVKTGRQQQDLIADLPFCQ